MTLAGIIIIAKHHRCLSSEAEQHDYPGYAGFAVTSVTRSSSAATWEREMSSCTVSQKVT